MAAANSICHGQLPRPFGDYMCGARPAPAACDDINER